MINIDCIKAGKLILSLRKEKNMTQKEIADALNISDKTISKWERGLGCPDISCCGRKLVPLVYKKPDEEHKITVEAGRFIEKNGEIKLPLSITVHHSTTDGWHINKFLDELQYAIHHWK